MNKKAELIKTFKESDYKESKINLHLHTNFSDGEADFESLIKQAKDKNYKYISITDHNTVEGHKLYTDEILITGVEFDVWYKYIFFHLLAYGIDINNEDLTRFLAKNKSETEKDIVRIFAKRNIKDLIKAIHNAGGIAVLAHPACCWALNMESFIKDLVSFGLDGLEIYYPYPRWRKYLKFCDPKKLEKIADKYNLIKTGGTDLHGTCL